MRARPRLATTCALLACVVAVHGAFAGGRAATGTAAAATVPAAAAPAAGQAIVETWRATDASGSRTLTVIRDDDTVEVRVPGLPIRVWRRLADGVELRELDPAAGTMVVHAPGDLRAVGREPDWSRLVAPPQAPGATMVRASTTQAPVASAFTDTGALHEVDGADDGD